MHLSLPAGSLALLLASAPATASDPVAPADDTEAMAAVRDASTAMADLAAAVSPATVFIEADKSDGMATGLAELLDRYQLPRPGRSARTTDSTGSGVFIDEAGIVLTNHHVVSGAQHAVVTLHDERRFVAEIVGGDPRTDLAVLRIVGEGPFPWAQLRGDDPVRVGEQVMAVGHPYGFQFTVTTGIISAVGRRDLFRSEIQDYLQTDAVLSAGSSGGPLFDLDGRVVGINTAVFTPRGGPAHVGIGFAIPAHLASRVARELVTDGRVARASLGLTTRDRRASLERPRPGAEITRVTPESPSAAAGLKPGDVIVAVDGEPVTGSADLRGLVLARGVAADLEIELLRADQVVKARVRTGDEEALTHPDVALPDETWEWGGMTLGVADEAALLMMGVEPPDDRRWPGLLVYTVDADGPADVAGIVPGDLLLDVGETPIRSAEDLPRKGRRAVTVRFWRDGGDAWAAVAGL